MIIFGFFHGLYGVELDIEFYRVCLPSVKENTVLCDAIGYHGNLQQNVPAMSSYSMVMTFVFLYSSWIGRRAQRTELASWLRKMCEVFSEFVRTESWENIMNFLRICPIESIVNKSSFLRELILSHYHLLSFRLVFVCRPKYSKNHIFWSLYSLPVSCIEGMQ